VVHVSISIHECHNLVDGQSQSLLSLSYGSFSIHSALIHMQHHTNLSNLKLLLNKRGDDDD